jgi:succinate dehydrogenase (ubiquinone) cytochrome b560 subunit
MQPKRPLSPHLSIYQPQLTWLMSIGHRFTGAFAAAGYYGALVGYGVAGPTGPQANQQLMQTLIQNVRQAPTPFTTMGKLAVSVPVAYHSYNGVRHLLWDLGYCLSLRGVYASGWTVNALTILSAGYFSLFK